MCPPESIKTLEGYTVISGIELGVGKVWRKIVVEKTAKVP